MRSSFKKEDSGPKKKYVFFSDPDIILKRAETSAAAAQVKQGLQVQQQQDCHAKHTFNAKTSDLPIQFDLKSLENLLSYHPIQPYPFTFISAVKRKLALGDRSGICKKAYDSCWKEENEPHLTILKSNSTQNLCQVVHKMDFIRPLKVPDLKITPKSLDFSVRENIPAKDLVPAKFEVSSKEHVHERADKSTRSFERVQRKLDFSMSDGSSVINSDIEPLKVPNISITSNLSKKKEHIRESSREKENRSKRIKKDDSLFVKQDEMGQDVLKRSKSPRHASRKEFGDSTSESTSTAKPKIDRLPFHIPRESDFASTKTKTKNFATSTAKKDNDKRHRPVNTRSLKSTRDNSSESKSRICSNESLSDRSTKLLEKITTRDSSRNVFENTEHRYKDDFHLLKQSDDQKHISPLENRTAKQHKVANQSQGKTGLVTLKEQARRTSEKIKVSTSKADGKIYITNCKESEDVEIVTDTNSSLRARSPCTTQSIKKDSEKTVQDTSTIISNKASEDSKYTNDLLPHFTSTSNKEDESFSQSIPTTTKNTSNDNEPNNSNESSLSEALLDPRRISFRDESQLQQEEFCDLITPDMNLMLRSKRKKQLIQSKDVETDIKNTDCAPVKMETEKGTIPLLHPTALHMQFQAELHFLDSFNESLRQVMDVEKCLLNVKRDRDRELLAQHDQPNVELKSHPSKVADDRKSGEVEHYTETSKLHKPAHIDKGMVLTSNEVHHAKQYIAGLAKPDELDNNLRKTNKPVVKAVEVQTQTVNDIATQTDIRSTRRNIQNRCPEIRGITYERGCVGDCEIPQLSIDSVEQFEDLDQIEEISIPSKLRTMSEISLHETTSSIRTETGTEISISTRDVTCSFNKYLDLEIAQLIKDEKQRYDKIEMLFKSREKTLNDRTKKLVKLEEQKRALRDTGQDSRISSVKKKQRALLLKLQEEKDEMNRLKELHKIASQERKLMLQKQRNMFNPQMSTKNILTKLKRSADSQSPRRLSGPMKGYDIRSNSSMSSLVDSDKSQHDRSQTDPRLPISENDLHFPKLDASKGDKYASFIEDSNTSLSRFDKSNEAIQGDSSQEKCPYNLQKDGSKAKYEIKSRKFDEKMPKTDILRLKSHQHSVESKLIPGHSMNTSGQYLFEKEKSPDVSQSLQENLSKSISEHAKSESDTLVEELSKKSKPSQVSDGHLQSTVSLREKESQSKTIATNTETIPEEISSISQDTVSKTSKSSQVSEDILQINSKSSKKSTKSIYSDKDNSKNSQYISESKSSSKRKSSKCQKSKSSSSILTENILRSKSTSQVSEEFIKHHNKRSKVEKEFLHSYKNNENAVIDNPDLHESQSSLQALCRHSKAMKDKNSKILSDIINDCESKENILCRKIFDRNIGVYENPSYSQEKNVQHLDNVSTKSQVSTFAVSHHSSGESDRNYSRSVVVRSQDHDLKASKKLEQILNAREAALASRKNYVEEWMAWHTKLRAEEDRVARMEQAALKLVTATSNVFSQQDTTISSDTSDIEGRIELLTEKLTERRIEMSRLKREARKQTKQKLRALEANLLNQIKKYDTTIHEMRKKIDSKKGITKDSEKLAIESKSLADFKVPEIPLKRIQDLYKSSDLLRSRSESDLFSTKRQPKHLQNSYRTGNIEDRSDRNELRKSIKGINNIIIPEHLNSAKMDRSIQSIFDECGSEQIESDKLGSVSISSVSDDVHSDKEYSVKAYVEEMRDSETIMSEVEKASVSEDIKTEISTGKSDLDIPTASDTKISRSETTVQSELVGNASNLDTPLQQSRSKGISLMSGIGEVQDTEYSEILSEHLQHHAEGSNPDDKTDKEVFDCSKKLDFLRLNNKNLNEDISSLENELKVLSEIMSRISKKSNEDTKSEIHNEERSTLKDVSEMLKSDINEPLNDVKVIKNQTSHGVELDENETNSDVAQFLTSSAKLKSYDYKDNKRLVEEVDNVISVIMPRDEVCLSRSNQEIDYKARSKEILNEIEKSIISEHIKAAESDINRSNALFESTDVSSRKGHAESSNDEVSLQTDDKLKTMVYSAQRQGKQSIYTENNVPEAAYTSQADVDIRECAINMQDSRSEVLVKETNASCVYTNESLSSKNAHSENNANIAFDTESEASKTETLQRSSNVAQPNDRLQVPTNRSKNTWDEDTHRSINDTVHTGTKTNTFNISSEHKEEMVYIDKEESKSCSYTESVQLNIEVSPKSCKTFNYDTDRKQNTCDSNVSFVTDESSKHKNGLELISTDKASFDREDWTISDSFDVPQNVVDTEWEQSQSQNLKSCSDDSSSNVFSEPRDVSKVIEKTNIDEFEAATVSGIGDMSVFIPKGESTNIDTYGIKFNETMSDSHIAKSNDELDDILDIIARDNSEEQKREENLQNTETDDLQKVIQDSAIKILDKVEKSIESNSVRERIVSHMEVGGNDDEIETAVDSEIVSIPSSSNLKHKSYSDNDISLNINDSENIKNEENVNYNKPVIDISLRVQVSDNGGTYHMQTETQEVIITELESGSMMDEVIPEFEINAEVELAEDEPIKTNILSADEREYKVHTKVEEVLQDQNYLEPVIEQDSSDGEQLDNLVETVESGLEMIEKKIETPMSDSKLIPHDVSAERLAENKESPENTVTLECANNFETAERSNTSASDVLVGAINKTYEVLKDPEYEDISEESLEVSEILDKSEFKRTVALQKSSIIPEKYEAVQKSEEVLRILDEIAQKSLTYSESSAEKRQANLQNEQNLETKEKLKARISNGNDMSSRSDDKSIEMLEDIQKENVELSADVLEDQTSTEEKEAVRKYGAERTATEKCEQDVSSDSSEGRDTPKGVSEIEMDSPRDPSDSRLDIDVLNDDLLSGTNATNQNAESKNNYNATPIVGSSEKDIEAMIDKIKASLGQPGLEVAELEAKLLSIEQLQIELEIKKLEAEEVTYYVREIPNKPPPPYTPPGGGRRISTSLSSPFPSPAVVPSNVEELTAFTEKATALIYKAKESGEDIMSLEAPPEICELTKENDETMKKDRRIYNTFLFDLCKETIAEIYQAEYEKPGPSWTKPNVKTKPTVKIPKSVEELNEYVSKEVATLFGFKTKLQRENMVMRWSRKRRDRVDELLAREAQAEEDEWTKFHHDELAVKNGLTVAILDTLIMETVNVVKVAYAKKRKIMV